MIIDLQHIDQMFALIDKVERAGMGIPQAIDSWQSLLQVDPHYQVVYNPERTMVRLDIEVVDDPISDPNDPINDLNNSTPELTSRQQTILSLLVSDGGMTMEFLSKKLHVSMKTVKREMALLQKLNRIKCVGANKNGVWKVL